MTRSPIDDATRYARAIERRWARLWEQPVVLSPRDWSRIARWHALGIPLEIVEEAMRAEVERVAGRSAPRRLAALASQVEEAWAVVVDGRRGDACGSAGEESDPAAERWRRCRDRQPEGAALRELLDGLLSRADGGADTESLDDELDRSLPDAVDQTLLDRVTEEVSAKLTPFRSRMSVEEFEKTRRRSCTDRLRRRLDLPRLAQSPADT